MAKIPTESYKGVRDFYPEDMFVQNYIFSTWKKVVESFGYTEYTASLLEPAELYAAKTGEEIVNEQTYTFEDRGGRKVTLRPEMTPTVARMVAARQNELAFPLRWYSIPNLFRYEKPQRGRVREHWQLNVDLFGVSSTTADIEVIHIAYKIMRELGAQESDFVVKINSRKIMTELFKKFNLKEESAYKISKIIDKKNKISESAFLEALTEIMGETSAEFAALLNSNEKLLEFLGAENEHVVELVNTIDSLLAAGVGNVMFDPTLMRGFDYYTGIVFEVFDLHPDNNRSVFGGGRYDDLLDIFGMPKVPAFGFGAGDVTARDFLETHNLLPVYVPPTHVYIAVMPGDKTGATSSHAQTLAATLRARGVNVAVDISTKKIGDQIKIAHKQMIPYVLVVGENEVASATYSIKQMSSGAEQKVTAEEIVGVVKTIK